MAKYYRSNPYLGIYYEIPPKVALRKIYSKYWMPVWDEYSQTYSTTAYYNMRDAGRDYIFIEQ